MEIRLASPRGFCAGVDRAIAIVELALERFGAPVYVRHEIVHNRHVVDGLRAKGAVFVDDPAEAPRGSLLVYSAHGVSPAVREAAARQGLRTIDATCPLVTKVHVEAQRFAREDIEIVLVGHAGHVEVEGTLGQAPERMRLVETVEDAERLQVEDPERLAVLTQTTLSVDDTRDILEVLKRRFPAIRLPRKDDICYAGQAGHLVESAADIDPAWLLGVERVAVTAGASAPEELVEEVVERLRALAPGVARVEPGAAVEEGIVFQLPAELR